MLNREAQIRSLRQLERSITEAIVFSDHEISKELSPGFESKLLQALSLVRVRRLALEYPPAPPLEGQEDLPF